MRGTVKNFDNTKGFGFIIPEGEGNDILYITLKLRVKDIKL